MCFEDDCPVEELRTALKILATHAYDASPSGCCIKLWDDPYYRCESKPTRDDCIQCMQEYSKEKAFDIHWKRNIAHYKGEQQ